MEICATESLCTASSPTLGARIEAKLRHWGIRYEARARSLGAGLGGYVHRDHEGSHLSLGHRAGLIGRNVRPAPAAQAWAVTRLLLQLKREATGPERTSRIPPDSCTAAPLP